MRHELVKTCGDYWEDWHNGPCVTATRMVSMVCTEYSAMRAQGRCSPGLL